MPNQFHKNDWKAMDFACCVAFVAWLLMPKRSTVASLLFWLAAAWTIFRLAGGGKGTRESV
jgi:hypothetical protein